MQRFKIERKILIIALAGMVARVFFVLIGAKFYFNRPNIFADGDTSAWAQSFKNWYETGIYTLNPSNDYGYFGRMPGYSFFMGIFYSIVGDPWKNVYPFIGWFQTLLDFFAIILIYRIGEKIFNNKKTSLLLAGLYAFYPFIIVWTPVVYSEYMSVFILLISIYYFVSEERKYNYALSGLFLGLGVLFRPQLMLLLPVLLGAILIRHRKEIMPAFRKTIQFGLLFMLVYLPWPIRNYVNHDKLILTQDLRGIPNWNVDAIAFMEYIYSVKAEWEPQFSQIIENEKVVFPPEAYLSKEDSAKLEKVIYLSQNCGSGFSHWKGYWQESFNEGNCNEEIKKIFDELRFEQMQKNPFHFWVTLPLLNLKKAIFKLTLYDTKTLARKLASILFVYRTLLILLGAVGCIYLMKSNQPGAYMGGVMLCYFLLLYIALCAGVGPQFRNIEMRYFLPADILLLIPGAFMINTLLEKVKRKAI